MAGRQSRTARYPCGVTRTGPDPLAETDLLIVDGTNLLFALRRGSSGLPAAALIGRLRAIIPAGTTIELVFDGRSERGMRSTRIAAGVTVRYAAPLSADAAIMAGADRFDSSAIDRLLIVSDDRGLRDLVERRGARTARCAWLIGRLGRTTLSSPTTGNARRPAPPLPGIRAGDPKPEDASGAGRGGWSPGRGATTKHGNGRRAPRSARHP